MLLLDADVLIDMQRSYPPAVSWSASLSEVPSVPGFVVMELVQDARNKKEVNDSLALVAPMKVVWPKERDCARALRLFVKHHLKDGLGLIDALVASCALSFGVTFPTNSGRSEEELLLLF